jgi:hypothetical protein
MRRNHPVDRKAQRGNPAKGLVVVALTGTDRALALDFHIDRDALAQAQALDGKYLLGTNAFHLSAHPQFAYLHVSALPQCHTSTIVTFP